MSSYGLRTTPPPPPLREVPVDANGNSLRFHHVQFYVDSLKPLEHYKQIERNFAALQAAVGDSDGRHDCDIDGACISRGGFDFDGLRGSTEHLCWGAPEGHIAIFGEVFPNQCERVAATGVPVPRIDPGENRSARCAETAFF